MLLEYCAMCFAYHFGTSRYLAMYCVERALDAETILAIKHQREYGYK